MTLRTLGLSIALLPCLLLATPASFAGTDPSPGQLQIDALTTTYDAKAHTYRVLGDVRITLPKLTVTCREAMLYANSADTQIMRIVFSGDVEARKGSNSFRANRITYYVGERRLVAEGATHTRLNLPEGASGAPAGP